MSNILITSAGQRVSLVRAFQKEVKRVYPSAKVYTVDLNPNLAPACHVSDGYRTVKMVTDENYVTELLDVCLELNIRVIIPTIDTELLVLSENKQLFLSHGIIPVVSSVDFVKVCRDKREVNKFFKLRDINTPKDIDKENVVFPFFVKPYDGSLSKDTYLIRSKEELRSFHFENEKLMFMEYIDHAIYDEYTVDTYYDKNGNLRCVVPRKRIFVRAGEVSKAKTVRNELVNHILERLSYIEGAIGCLTIQFFLNPITKHIVGIEINPRFGGGFPLSYFAGANFPRFIIEEYFAGLSVDFFDDWEDGLLMLRYDGEILVRSNEI